MNAPLALILGVQILAALPSAGTWRINNWAPGDDVRMSMTRREGSSRWQVSTGYSLSELEGLTREQLRALRGEVAFRLRSDAGTFVFEGTTTMGVGSGNFRFEPDPAFRGKLVALGYPAPDDETMLDLALRRVSLDFAAEVKKLGLPEVEVDDLFSLRDRGIGADEIRDIAAFGFPALTAADVARLHDHGVDGGYLQGMKASGFRGLEVGDVIRLHDHGISPAYVARVEASGFKDLSVEQIVRLHDHGVD